GRAGDHVRNAIAIRVAGRLDADAQLIARLAGDTPQQRPGPRRVHVDTSGGGAVDVLRRRGRHDVGDAVPIEVADHTRDPAELVARGLAVPLPDHGNRF